jgi:predicted small integral membrane protein
MLCRGWLDHRWRVFRCIVLMLIGMTVWEIRSPTIERKGFLPMRTTRGDRLFIGLLAAPTSTWPGRADDWPVVAAAIGFVMLALIMRWGDRLSALARDLNRTVITMDVRDSPSLPGMPAGER